MCNPNDDTKNYTPSVDTNYWLKRLGTQLNEPTNKNSTKVHKKLFKRNYTTLGTSVINISMSPPSLVEQSIVVWWKDNLEAG